MYIYIYIWGWYHHHFPFTNTSQLLKNQISDPSAVCQFFEDVHVCYSSQQVKKSSINRNQQFSCGFHVSLIFAGVCTCIFFVGGFFPGLQNNQFRIASLFSTHPGEYHLSQIFQPNNHRWPTCKPPPSTHWSVAPLRPEIWPAKIINQPKIHISKKS